MMKEISTRSPDKERVLELVRSATVIYPVERVTPQLEQSKLSHFSFYRKRIEDMYVYTNKNRSDDVRGDLKTLAPLLFIEENLNIDKISESFLVSREMAMRVIAVVKSTGLVGNPSIQFVVDAEKIIKIVLETTFVPANAVKAPSAPNWGTWINGVLVLVRKKDIKAKRDELLKEIPAHLFFHDLKVEQIAKEFKINYNLALRLTALGMHCGIWQIDKTMIFGTVGIADQYLRRSVMTRMDRGYHDRATELVGKYLDQQKKPVKLRT